MTKEHVFFERFLNNDLDKLKDFLLKTYDEMENQQIVGVTPLDPKSDLWVKSQSFSTIKWREYNVFQFYNAELHNVYTNLSELVHEACDYYKIDFKKQNFYAQGWFNVNFTKKGKLDWHDHGPYPAPRFHGYYSINAEPSITHYKINGEDFDNHNVNNRMILSEMTHPHAMADWDWEGPRITLAYDVLPLKDLIHDKPNESLAQQHWVPMI
jgi:hypothetical protein